MSLFHKKEGLRKAISVLTLYAVFIQQIIPYGWSANNSRDYYVSSHSSSSTAIEEETVQSVNAESARTIHVDDQEEVQEVLSQVMIASSGGGQAETSGFSLGSTDGMVNKFTGDFSYSIPLMDVEGYPIVLAYNSNIGMNSESSWVGLGWDLSVGAVSREMRGIPDEFNGEQEVVKEINQIDGTTSGEKYGLFALGGYKWSTEQDIFLTPSIQLTTLWGSYFSPMVGNGRTFDFGLQSTFSIGQENGGWSVAPSFGIGYSRDSKNGIGTSSNFGLSVGYQSAKENLQGGLGATFSKSFNSRVGLTSKSVGSDLSFGYFEGSQKKDEKNGGKGGSMGVNVSGGLRYGTRSMIPSVTYSSTTEGNQNSMNVSVTSMLGTGEVGFFGGGGLIVQSHSISNSLNLKDDKIYQPAYGYFHSAKRKYRNSDIANASYPIMDFNRGTRNEYSENMTYLDFSAQTYDIFQVSTGGYSATFRARRTDIGTYYDASTKSKTDVSSNQIRTGVEFVNGSPRFKVGYSFGENDSEQKSGNFKDYLEAGQKNLMEFDGETVSNSSFDNTVYFKTLSEMTPENQDALEYLGGEQATRFAVSANNSDKTIDLTNELKTSNSIIGNKSGTTANALLNEVVRSTHVKPLTVTDYSVSSPSYLSYDENDFDYGNNTYTITRNSGHREDNHISAIETMDNNGTRYVFGIPAYNLSSVQCMFAVDPSSSENTVDASTGLVPYVAADASVNNLKGRSRLFERTTVPDYAHSFLLTEMLSSNYSDVTGDGPSTDDVGTWYKFNYTQVYGKDDSNVPYEWRYPVAGDAGGKEAFYDPAALGSDLDDKANYSYGEKEVWYVHTVESKNMIAEFHLDNRQDAFGVFDQNGELDTNMPLKYLSKIVLYNRSERINNVNAEPIQTVEFEYDYSLCPGAPANPNSYTVTPLDSTTGKLTLKAIRVYAGASEEMALSSYEFTYSDVNPDFNYADIDGWGNYKDNDPSRPNAQFPYANQTKVDADASAQAWRLTSILNPSGGKTEVEYEADSYAFVQNQCAMQHSDIHGMTSVIHLLDIIDGGSGQYTGQNTSFNYNEEITDTELTTLGGLSFMNEILDGNRPHSIYTDEFGRYNIDNSSNKVTVPNNVIIFPLEDEYSNSLNWEDASQKVEDEYFKQFDDFGTILTGATNPKRPLYFKIHSEIDKSGTVEDYVPFFAQIASNYNDFFNNEPTFDDDVRAIGVMPNVTGQNYKYGYVVLEPSYVGENMKKSEIPAKDRLQAHPLQKAVLEYARMNLPDTLYGSCPGCTPDLSIDKGVMMGKKDVNRIMIEQGFAKKMIADMSVVRLASPDSTKYGGNGRVSQITYSDNWNAISGEYLSSYTWRYEYGDRTSTTGVASNEPGGIRDENALYYWATYQNVKEKFPDESKFMPLPVADLIYPSPIIGYQTVQVEFEGNRDKGYSESNYYTSKDFPTVFKATKLDKTERVEKNVPILGFTTNLQGLSQGYVVVTNDYHGKMKSAVTYDGLGNKQAQSIYEYYGLNDKVKVLDREGNIAEESIAMEYDIHNDANYAQSLSTTYSLGIDVKFGLAPPYFNLSPSLTAGQTYEGFWSNTLIKHINKSAVVRNIQSWNMQSVNNARNLAFDRETGNVIVSSLQDEFDDTLYSFAYPAHWYYDQCRSVSEVDGFSATGDVSSNQLEVTSHDIGDYFVEGDYISISNGTTTDYAYILFFSGSDATLINANGYSYSGVSGSGLTITILESGRDNILGATMQSAVTKKKPDLSVGTFTFPQDEVISMSAMTLKDRDNLKCREGDGSYAGTESILGSVLNPYPLGIKGKLIGEAQYAYQSERINDTHAHGIRFDGTIDTIVPFYEISSGEWYRINESGHPDHDSTDHYQKWRNLGNTTMFDQFGKPLESKDQIDIRSTVLYGYNPELEIVPIAQAVNARKQEIAFDGFEDYDYFDDVSLGYEKNHFSFSDALNANVTIDSDVRHSGLQSLRIAAGDSAMVTKGVGETWENPSDGFTSSNFVADTCLCIPTFAPTSGDYILGAWIKVGSTPGAATTYSNANIRVTVSYTGGTNNYDLNPSGPIIDGWQRVEGQFTIPSNGTSVSVKLRNNTSDQAYFDDLRIHPFLAGMTTTVYDPKTLLPLATHDGYNFTTFYNYDENLNQVRVRVETIEGIKTVSEVEGGGQKRFE